MSAASTVGSSAIPGVLFVVLDNGQQFTVPVQVRVTAVAPLPNGRTRVTVMFADDWYAPDVDFGIQAGTTLTNDYP